MDDDQDAHNDLFSELLLQRDSTRERLDVQLQTLFVRCFRKSKLFS